jgi:hypothetical protein
MSSDRQPTRLYPHGTTPEAPTCEGCGARVSPEIARVVGDNDGRVPRCRQCTEGISRTTRAATATAARGDGFRVAPEGRR